MQENNLKQIEKGIVNDTRNKIIITISVAIIVLSVIGGFIAWNILSSRIYIENSSISAPIINLSPVVGGVLQEIYVNAGDYVQMSSPIARVGNELIKATTTGQILSINTNIGGSFGPGQVVATMINPSDLRVVGQVQEDKGLKDIKVGQTVIFTVDAFGSKEYPGIVDQINPTSNTGSIVFNISDARQVRDFDVKVRFDVNSNPELKNGMSARLWIYK